IWEASPPAGVVRQEAILIGIGVVFAAFAVWIKASPIGSSIRVQIPVMVIATVLTVLVMGTAGRWLGDDLPPLAAVSFATVFLHFEGGMHSRHFGYVCGIAVLGLGALWVYAVAQLMPSLLAVVLGTPLVIGL